MSDLKPSDLLNAHTMIQIGTYFDRVKVLKSGVKVASSDTIKDHYWNYAYNFKTEIENVPNVIAEIREYASSIDRQCVIYLTPDSKPTALSESLPAKLTEEEVWMTFNCNSELSKVNESLKIEEIINSQPGDEFINVFKNAYGSGAPDSPGYEGLPPEYIQAIEHSKPKGKVKVAHFIGRIKDKPVAISSIFCSPPYAGLYNVGTIHSERRKKYGWDLSTVAVKFAFQSECNNIFLQTQADSPVEELYSKMGFSRYFIGKFIVL